MGFGIGASATAAPCAAVWLFWLLTSVWQGDGGNLPIDHACARHLALAGFAQSLRACGGAMANVGAGLPQSTSRVRLLHEACRRNVYWLPPVQQCPIVPPKYEKIASAFAGLVLRATNWNALQLAKQ